MIEKIIDLSEAPAFISARGELLVIKHLDESPEEGEARKPARGARAHAPDTPPAAEATVPLSEIAAVVLGHQRITITKSALSSLAQAGAIVISCDEKFTPAAMSLPVEGHFSQTERFARQAQAPLPMKKRLWQQIIQEKIRAQGRVLLELRGDDAGFPALAERVRSGDPENVEALAARRYWTLLFADPEFIRDRDAPSPNALLNYGYAVLRAIIARAICAAGLHPSLGLHHHNRYDSFCLASDLMEPFRPVVDRAVTLHCIEFGPAPALDKIAKTDILSALTATFDLNGEQRKLFDIAARAASSLDAVFAGKRKALLLPELP
ncbi:MAG TPA: type II CRISPR-associated endonuclease Cas1 [bacterium]|nr:type II CRISPR-associated endonuclease Cas1 [bacterium]